MKKSFVLWLAILLVAAPMFAGVVKKTRSDVTFKRFGKFSLAQNEKLTADQKWTDSKSDFKGEGIAGGLAGKTFLKSGDTGEIIDLPALTIYALDNKKKEYTASPIKKLTEQLEAGLPKGEAPEKPEQARSEIKITRSEFKVEDTGETSTINNFACRKYIVTWIVEWEDTETGEKGSSRLASLVWTTPSSGTLQAASEEETKFARAYWEKIGLNVEKTQQDILGTNWLSLLKAMGRDQTGATPETGKFAAEMKKIQGYPIVIDGKYYATGQKPAAETAEKQQEEQPKSLKGVFGGLAKKVVKPKASDKGGGAEEPVLAYRIEVIELSLADLSSADFQVPAGYKKRG